MQGSHVLLLTMPIVVIAYSPEHIVCAQQTPAKEDYNDI